MDGMTWASERAEAAHRARLRLTTKERDMGYDVTRSIQSTDRSTRSFDGPHALAAPPPQPLQREGAVWNRIGQLHLLADQHFQQLTALSALVHQTEARISGVLGPMPPSCVDGACASKLPDAFDPSMSTLSNDLLALERRFRDALADLNAVGEHLHMVMARAEV